MLDSLLCLAPLCAPLSPAQGLSEAAGARLSAIEDALRAGERETVAPRVTELAAELEAEPEGRALAWRLRPRLVDALLLADFLEQYDPPRPESLVHGELRTYSPATGKLRLVYRAGELGDFLVLREGGAIERAGGEPLGERDLLLHPVLFQRPYSVSVRGRDYGRGGVLPAVACVLDYDDVRLVSFGQPGVGRLDVPAVVIELGRGSIQDSAPSKAVPGRPYDIEVRVREREILGLWNRSRLVHAPKERDDWGRFAIAGVAGWEEIEVEGVATRAWMRGLQDDAFQRALAAWRETFDDNAVLPAWLSFEHVGSAEAMARTLPAGMGEEGAEQVRELLRLAAEDEGEARTYLDDQLHPGVPEAQQAYLACLLELELWNLEEAAAKAAKLRELAPDFARARFLVAWIDGLLHDPEAAAERLGELSLEAPEDAELRGAQALLVLALGRRDEACTLLDQAARSGVWGDELEATASVLCRADTGPGWLESFQVESEHFRVVSDIDLRTCKEAAEVLEKALEHYQSRYRALSARDEERFRVYLFSGETGYQSYLAGATLLPAPDSLGIFVPSLRQLLIWNTPDRAGMLDTIRHEGLHQYLDRVLGDPPVWLDEGLGEYWGSADFTKTRSRQNDPTPERRARLRALRKELVPLERFLRVERGDFYGNPTLYYDQAWAFVHFLQHSGREHQRLFDALFDELASGTGPDEAVEAVFADVDLEELQRDFDRYVLALG